MQQASERPTFGLLHEDLAHCGVAALLIDLEQAAVLNANAAGWALLGIEAGDPRHPLPLDCAMPAVQQLRALPADDRTALRDPDVLDRAPQHSRGLRDDACTATRARSAWCVCSRWRVRQPAQAAIAADNDAPGPALRRGAAVQARARAANPAGRRHRLRGDPQGRALRPDGLGPLQELRAQHLRERAACDGRAGRHAEGRLRGSAGAPQLTFADIEPARIVESCLLVAQPLAEKAGLTLSAEVPANLPRIVADAVSLRQMLLNLLANAIKFARCGDRVKVTVAYDARRTAAHLGGRYGTRHAGGRPCRRPDDTPAASDCGRPTRAWGWACR